MDDRTHAALREFGETTAGGLSSKRKEQLWRGALAAGQPSGGRLWLQVAVLAGSAVVGAASFELLSPPRAAVAIEEVNPVASAHWRRTGDAVVVEAGQVRVQRGTAVAALTVTTPQLQAVVQNAAALFEVTDGTTRVLVESGEVAWRAKDRSGRVGAGQAVTIARAVAALAVAPRGPPVDACGAKAGSDAYRSCLQGEAMGEGLAAQAALFELGMIAHERGELGESVQLFRSYARRFPDGALAPEAAIALMVDLRGSGALSEASAEAAKFPERFPAEPRIDDVRRWAAEIP
jgi:TolA-binding protein